MRHCCCWLWLFLLWSSLATAFGTPQTPCRAANQILLHHGTIVHHAINGNSLLRRLQLRHEKGTAIADVRLLLTRLQGGDQPIEEPQTLLSTTSTSTSIPSNNTNNTPEPIPSKHTEEQTIFIEKALLQNVMFTSLPKENLAALMEAFDLITVPKDQVICRQGDSSDNDYAYLIYKGACTVMIDGIVVPEPYGTLRAKSIFGELGVLYNQTRAATITAKSGPVQLYRVPGSTLKQVLDPVLSDEDYLFHNDGDELAQIDQAINQVAGTKTMYGGDIIRQYQSNRAWLWRQWTGTVLKQNYRTTVKVMLFTAIWVFLVRHVTDPTWPLGLAPDPSHPIIQRLSIIKKVWSYQTSLTTFILTFFVNQAYGFWQDVVTIARKIQGRFNDFHLLLAVNCKRHKDGTYTEASERLMDSVGKSSRLLHALFWASQARRFRILCTPKGLARMASRGLLSSSQLKTLTNLDLPNAQKHNACLEWMMIRANQGLEDGTLLGGDAVRRQLLDQLCQLRGTYASVGDKLACRMPLAYTHFVQILVDTFVWMAPLALYAELGAFSIVCVGVMTLFYTGLLDLAKIFLDPLDNEDFTKNSIDMDLGVLIRESNGGSTRWKNAGAQLPFKVTR